MREREKVRERERGRKREREREGEREREREREKERLRERERREGGKVYGGGEQTWTQFPTQSTESVQAYHVRVCTSLI